MTGMARPGGARRVLAGPGVTRSSETGKTWGARQGQAWQAGRGQVWQGVGRRDQTRCGVT